MRWSERIDSFVEDFRTWDGPTGGVTGGNPLGWPAYEDLLHEAAVTSESGESVVTGRGLLGDDRVPVAVIASVFDFIGGSLGLAAGERVVRAYDRARTERLPLLALVRSGGARMQEGMLALVQMARAADAARLHAEAGLAQAAYLDSPSTGGVLASYASAADVVWAAPGALIGFAGPRVVELTTGERLPAEAHSAESAWGAGLVDAVLAPDEARQALAVLLGTIRTPNLPPNPSPNPSPNRRPNRSEGAGQVWEVVEQARAAGRPSGRAWLERIVPLRVELRGDRAGGVDPVVAAGIGTTLSGTPVGFVSLDRHTGSGRPRPAGYRTARRLLAFSARLGLPVLTLVDTAGADPGDASERGGLAAEIGATFAAIMRHPAPTVALVVGEGGSGGALALAATDRCLMLDGSIFSVIAPEGAAAILERDPGRAADVAPLLKLTGPDLVGLGVVDELVAPEDAHGTIEHALATARPGDGRARLDSATSRWLHPSP